MSALEKFFLFCAFISGVLFVIRFLAQLFGLAGEGDTDIQVGDADVNHVEPDVSFKLLTIQGLTAFFMMFGLVGFTLLRETRVHELVAMAGAVASGLCTVWIIGAIFSFTKGLQSSGTQDVKDAVGAEGTVYLKIPAGGTGKVIVSVRERQREFEAVSADNEEIATGVAIKVSDTRGGRLVVKKYN